MSARDTIALLPCPNPWCSSHRRDAVSSEPFIFPNDHDGGPVRVSCPVCPIEGPTEDTVAEAITSWNRRTNPPGFSIIHDGENHGPTVVDASIAARFTRLDGIVSRILWIDAVTPALHNEQTKQAFADLAEYLFAAGVDTAIRSLMQEGAE